MPTYDYTCDACDHTWEEFQSIKAAPTKKCPQCKKSKARRLISAGAGFLFKGSGFYITDYRSDSYKARAKEESGAASGGKDVKKGDADSKRETPAPETSSPKDSKDKGKLASQSAS
jgi:putative FmdB family regulatory protein